MPALRYPQGADEALLLAGRGVGGFCVFGGDDRLADLLDALQAAAPHPLIIASDIEDGVGQQVAGWSVHPPAAALDPDAAEACGARTALEARPLGITMAFAPVCDVASEPRNPIIAGRAFSEPGPCAARFIAGARRFGLRTCAKHFPGHGATIQDSHAELPVVEVAESVWRERDLPPFLAAMAAGVDAVMSAHIDCVGLTGEAGLPATLSKRVMTGLLREELGFSGLLVTDALLMAGVLQGRTEAQATRLAILAGCDMVLCPKDVEGVLAVLGSLDCPGAHARIARAADPLPDPVGESVAGSVRSEGPLPVGPGPHPLVICDLLGGGEALAAAAGVAFERRGPDGELLETGAGPGLERPTVAVLRKDKAWGGALELPAGVRRLCEAADVLILLGPEHLAAGLGPQARVLAPGQDPATLRAVCRRAFALNSPGRSS